MTRIAGINLPARKHIRIALRAIYGIGATRALAVCSAANIDPQTKVCDLSSEDEIALQQAVMRYESEIEGNGRRAVLENIKRLREIKCYRGLRHLKRLPVRGQRSRTNARTQKEGRSGGGSSR